jgi:predicted RNA-binding Zn-ribbon protein involved in translation (DUF1610 family)
MKRTNEPEVVQTSNTKTPESVNPAARVYSYKHPGRVEGSKKPKYEDIDKFYECPECGGTIDNYSWHCFICRTEATVYNEPIGGKINYRKMVNKEATKALRGNLKRINPWTGEEFNGK